MKIKSTFPSILYILMFAPSFVMVAFGSSSMAAGLMFFIICLYIYLIIFFTENKDNISFNVGRAMFFLILIAFVFFHSMLAAIRDQNYQLERFLSSYISLFLICIGSYGFVNALLQINSSNLSRWIGGMGWFLVVNAIIGLMDIKIFPNTTYKPAGVFSEPSHLALVLAPILAYSCAINNKNCRKFLLFFFVWGILIENLTTLVVVAFCFLIRLKINFSKRFVVSSLVFIIIVGIIIQTTDLEYFFSRLKISSDSDNLSVLVLLQGWETAFFMLNETEGMGSGFQQFGFLSVPGDISNKIARFGLDGLNQFDGGSTAAKLVGEFGYIGLLVVFVFIVSSFNALMRLRKAERTGESGGRVLLIAGLYTFIVELLFRGVGYFSPSSFLALCGISFLLTTWQLNWPRRLI
jgi:hypothetical protein